MKKYIITFICDLEKFKTGIKELHWSAKTLSQHQLCDGIASIISDYQDKVAEVEQSISGKFPVNILKGDKYNVTNLKKFVEDVISSTNTFYSKLKNEGDDYIGMRSDTEAFLSDMQRQLYLVDFTIKEGLKQRLRNKINENRVEVSNGKETYSLTENELREFVSEALKNVKTKLNKHSLDRYAEEGRRKIVETNLGQIRRANRMPLSYNSHRVLEDEGFYVCVDTIYGKGIYTWIGDLKDAKQIERSSEGYALGPFKTYREAATEAKRKGLRLGIE